MKIAIPYENGEVFQHFGHSEAFKIYDIQDNRVVSDDVVPADGTGHEALAAFLAQQGVNVLVCGGLGSGADEALSAAGITVCSGVHGDADTALIAYLNGELESAGINCDHHEKQEPESSGCGGGCGSCGGGCGGCGGGCHSGPDFEGRNVGKVCHTHYRGTLNDGTQFDSSYDRGEPLEFVCGGGMMIHGFDKAVADLEVGQEIDIHLTPDEAYGYPDPRAVFTIELSQLPDAKGLSVGEQVVLYGAMGQPMQVRVTAKDDTSITFDANHEMAGKELNFHIQLVDVED